MPSDPPAARQRAIPLLTTGFYSVGVPPQRRGRRFPALIALHGYGGSRESLLAFATRLAPGGFVVAALQGTHQHAVRRGGHLRPVYGWGTQGDGPANQALHHGFVLAVIEDLVRTCRVDPEKVFLFGFSQSVGLNYRFAFTHPGRVRGVIAVCGGVPGDWETNRRYRPSPTDVLHISGTRDPHYPPERVRPYKAALERRARSVEHLSYPVGHRFPRGAVPAVRRWLLARGEAAPASSRLVRLRDA
jgi:predicted esterase